jgi:hypothetical protein
MGGGHGHAPAMPSLTAAGKVAGRGRDSRAGRHRASVENRESTVGT